MDCLPSAIFQYLSCPALVSFTMKVPIINSPHIPPIEKHVSWCFCCVCCMCIFRSPYCSNEKGPGVIVIVFFLPCPMVVTVTEGIQETYINIIIIQITKCLHESSRYVMICPMTLFKFVPSHTAKKTRNSDLHPLQDTPDIV